MRDASCLFRDYCSAVLDMQRSEATGSVAFPDTADTAGSPFVPVSWREYVAVGIIANDLSATTIARCVGAPLADVRAALRVAESDGVLVDGAVDPVESARLVGELNPVVVAEVHTAVARYLLSEGPSRLLDAIAHARSADTLAPSMELVAIADRAASTSLSVGDYESARRFLEFAHEASTTDAPVERAERLCSLGAALDGLGLVAEARERFASAFEVAELADDARLAAAAAVFHALPVDWYAGDRRTTALLQRAEALDLDADQRVMVRAARAMAEMRIPVPTGGDQQLAWVTRPTVAQPLADAALADSVASSERARLLASLAWRTTHRAPQYLARRRAVTTEAFDLAQSLREPGRQVDAAVMLAVDALESADRPGFDHALTVVRWIAEVDGNPRLAWHAHAVAAGAAHLDGDVEAAEQHRHAARAIGLSIGSPAWLGADLLLLGQELLGRLDHDEIRQHLPDDEGTIVLNPLGKLIVGLGHALIGETERAATLLGRAWRQFDAEASWLLCLTRAIDLTVKIGGSDLDDELWSAAERWANHVAVDSQAWFCDGPVSGWLAILAHHRGDTESARRYLFAAEPVARRLGDVRSLERLAELRRALNISSTEPDPGARELDERELAVLRFVVDGWSNPQIAEALAYSPSTIRNDLTSIFRKLRVSTRAEAAAAAIRLGLARRDDVSLG